jgi:hypothetical protein
LKNKPLRKLSTQASAGNKLIMAEIGLLVGKQLNSIHCLNCLLQLKSIPNPLMSKSYRKVSLQVAVAFVCLHAHSEAAEKFLCSAIAIGTDCELD